MMEKENVNHHKIYNIYAKNNVFLLFHCETLCGMIKNKSVIINLHMPVGIIKNNVTGKIGITTIKTS